MEAAMDAAAAEDKGRREEVAAAKRWVATDQSSFVPKLDI